MATKPAIRWEEVWCVTGEEKKGRQIPHRHLRQRLRRLPRTSATGFPSTTLRAGGMTHEEKQWDRQRRALRGSGEFKPRALSLFFSLLGFFLGVFALLVPLWRPATTSSNLA